MEPEEIIKQSPFREKLQTILDGFRVSCTEKHDSGVETGTPPGGVTPDSVQPEKTEAEKLAESSTVLVSATNRILTHQGVYINEQTSIPGMTQELENTPLACIKASPETGNVLMLIDSTQHKKQTYQGLSGPASTYLERVELSRTCLGPLQDRQKS